MSTLSAQEALAYIRASGGRVHRMREGPQVICLTSNEQLKDWLLAKGARLFVPPNDASAAGGYRRARDAERLEWDLILTPMRVEGSLWEAAGAEA